MQQSFQGGHCVCHPRRGVFGPCVRRLGKPLTALDVGLQDVIDWFEFLVLVRDFDLNAVQNSEAHSGQQTK